MKKLLFTALLAAAACSASAQSLNSYFMDGSNQRTLLNPALAPDRASLGFPALGGVSLSTYGNISLDDILYNTDGELVTLLDSRVTSDMLLNKLDTDNTLNFDARVNLLSFGFYTPNGKSFWSVDLNTRITGGVNVPYELFDFAKNLGSTSLQNLNISADTYIEAGLSYSRTITKNLYIGARVKALFGYARANMNITNANIDMEHDEWKMAAKGNIQTSGAMLDIETQRNNEGNEYIDLNCINFNTANLTKTAGFGLAADLGANYSLFNYHLHISAAITDLGYINWEEDYTYRGNATVSEFTFSGATAESNGNVTSDFNLPEFRFETASCTDENLKQRLNATINVGAEYNILRNKIGVGILYSRRKIYNWSDESLLLSARLQPVKWLTLLGSYDFCHNDAIGLAFNFSPNWINIFVATDVVFAQKTPQYIPIKQSNMNITAGVSFPLGKRGKRHNYTYEITKDPTSL